MDVLIDPNVFVAREARLNVALSAGALEEFTHALDGS